MSGAEVLLGATVSSTTARAGSSSAGSESLNRVTYNASLCDNSDDIVRIGTGALSNRRSKSCENAENGQRVHVKIH